MKECIECKQTKSLDEFPWRNKSKGVKHSRCKICSTAYNREYYKNVDKQKQINRVTKNNKKIKDKYFEWKSQQKCSMCPEDSSECLDFHHLDPNEKDFDPSRAKDYGWKRFLTEIEKCIILCSNCHRKVHSGRIKLP